MSLQNINWYPGHMKKTRELIASNLKLVDIVIEVIDARIPISSRNPVIDELTAGKQRIIILNKSDLSDGQENKRWIEKLSKDGSKVMTLDSMHGVGIKELINLMSKIEDDINKDRVRKKNLRLMIVGVPNVGKSSLINRLTGKKSAKTGDKPGVTKGKQWLTLSNGMQLLDTPGILWPKFEDEVVGLKLALTGAIKDQLLPMDEVTIFGLNYFKTHYPEKLQERFKQMDLEQEAPEIIMEMTQKLGFREDYDRFYQLFVKNVRDGKLGRYTLDRVGEIDAND